MFDLDTITRICTISDVHGEYEQLKRAVKYAKQEGYFIVFLGDLTDGGPKPMQCIQLVYRTIDEGNGIFIVGNHDKKFYSYSLGRPATLKPINEITLRDSGRPEQFLQVYKDLVEHKRTRFYFNIGNAHFAHAAIDPVVWTDEIPEFTTKRLGLSDKFVYGFHTGETSPEGWPIRSYKWIKDIPAGHVVVVGHDRVGLGKPHTKVKISSANDRGTVVYSDTSCGKDQKGPLSSVFLHKDKGIFKIQGVSLYDHSPGDNRK